MLVDGVIILNWIEDEQPLNIRGQIQKNLIVVEKLCAKDGVKD
jgi:hypothetical protein